MSQGESRRTELLLDGEEWGVQSGHFAGLKGRQHPCSEILEALLRLRLAELDGLLGFGLPGFLIEADQRIGVTDDGIGTPTPKAANPFRE